MTESLKKGIALKKMTMFVDSLKEESVQNTEIETRTREETKNGINFMAILFTMPIICIGIIVLMSSIGIFLKFSLVGLSIISLGAYYCQLKNINIFQLFKIENNNQHINYKGV